MAISLETLALARKLLAKVESKISGDVAGKGDTLDYDGSTLSLKSGDTTLSSVSVSGGESGYPMAQDAEVEETIDDVFGNE